jgi:hypothetical protein
MSDRLTNVELLNKLVEQHVETFKADPKTSLLQACYIECADGSGEIIGCPWSSELHRQVVLNALSVTMEEAEAVRYAFWAEVWRASEPFNKTPRPGAARNDPNRTEEVMTVVVSVGAPVICARQKIVRNTAGEVVELQRLPPDGHAIKGAITELLPQRTTH